MVKLSLWFGSAVFIAFSLSVRAQSPPKLVPLDSTGLITYYIADGIPPFGSQPGDIELATWAFKEWERSAGRTIRFEPIADEGVALHEIHFLLQPELLGGGIGGSGPPPHQLGLRQFDVSIVNTDLLGVLDAIVKAHGASSWHVTYSQTGDWLHIGFDTFDGWGTTW